ncbi:hypothetical protein GCM10011511_29050 [Puia dinghuensis]|uniref:Uncharacterized protein n=2 Tax=Puia dinghuensis TaxID=1792502 RepID=A0A8J2UDT3_9BACT|nr:hypothetical protein GCM10011511_29050 [Puia dinghuensis]
MKLTATILLFLLFSHGILYYLGQDIMLLESKIEAKLIRREASQDLILIKAISKQAVPGDDDELSSNGKLYDVARKVVTRDSVYYYGIEDTREEEVSNSLTDHFQHDSPITGAPNWRSRIHKPSGIDFFQIITGATIGDHPSSSATGFPSLIGHCCLGYLTHFTPPPKQSL